jgi:hypothetical protein
MNGMEMAALANAMMILQTSEENRGMDPDLVMPPLRVHCLLRTIAAIGSFALFLGVLNWGA